MSALEEVRMTIVAWPLVQAQGQYSIRFDSVSRTVSRLEDQIGRLAVGNFEKLGFLQ